jgi:allene oxide cyclase
MKRLLALCALAAAAVLAVAVSASGSGSPSRFTLTEHATTDATTDTGAAGDSAGDVLTFANAIYDAKDAKQVGSDQGYCVRVIAGKSYECAWTNSLHGGQIVVSGPFFDAKDSTLAITGGTGVYRSARGTMSLHALHGGKEYAFAFHIQP